MIRLIAAIDRTRGVSNEQGIPWQGKIPADTRYFREHTAQGAIVMGFRTYDQFTRPLHDRPNFVVSRSGLTSLRPGFVGVPDLTEFLHQHSHDLVWVIGGAAVYAQSMPLADELYITQLDADFHCTKFFPKFEDSFLRTSELGHHVENDVSFSFEIWRRNHEVPAD